MESFNFLAIKNETINLKIVYFSTKINDKAGNSAIIYPQLYNFKKANGEDDV